MSFTKRAGFILGVPIIVLASGFVAQAVDAVIEIEPGLYAYETSGFIGPQPILQKDYEYCLTEDLTKRTLSDLVAELQDDGHCSVSNVHHRAGHGEADVVCQNQDFGTARGHISADYSRTSYSVRANAKISAQGTMIPLSSKVDATRIGDCPPGWTPPPGISHK